MGDTYYPEGCKMMIVVIYYGVCDRTLLQNLLLRNIWMGYTNLHAIYNTHYLITVQKNHNIDRHIQSLDKDYCRSFEPISSIIPSIVQNWCYKWMQLMMSRLKWWDNLSMLFTILFKLNKLTILTFFNRFIFEFDITN